MSAGGFPETQWSHLLELRDADNPRRAELLQRLIAKYWKPAYLYVRAFRKKLPGEEAEDLTQGFFTMLLGRHDLEKLSPERGSFRGFLRTALKNFLLCTDRAARARPQLFPFGEVEAQWDKYAHFEPDQAFDRAWTRAVFDEAVSRLRDELQAEGQESHFTLFAAYCLDEDNQLTYEQLARREGLSEHTVRGRLRDTRRRLRGILRRIVYEYLRPEDDIESELKFILGE